MSSKDSKEVVEFLTLFQKLRDWLDDDETVLEKLAAEDESVKDLCIHLALVQGGILWMEKSDHEMFVAPVDPKFIAAWRDYESRFATVIAGIFLTDLGLDWESSPPTRKSPIELLWERADETAKDRAQAIEIAIDYAYESTAEDLGEFPEGFSDRIAEAAVALRKLGQEIGLDLRSVFRRRDLVPVVLIPSQVAKRYGSGEKLSLYTHLIQAHDAFVLGVPFAAVALMRSILEKILRDHYQAVGRDLEQMIYKAKSLPRAASKERLHELRKLANGILHFNRDGVRMPQDIEKEILSLFFVLRALIEEAPEVGHRK